MTSFLLNVFVSGRGMEFGNLKSWSINLFANELNSTTGLNVELSGTLLLVSTVAVWSETTSAVMLASRIACKILAEDVVQR